MATHYEACRAVFKERVLPHFPRAEERFKRHFKESYKLMKALPLSDGKHRRELNLDVALTVLGIKPVSIVDRNSELYRDNKIKNLFRNTGLGIMEGKIGPTVYDPVLVAPILSRITNRNVCPECAGHYLKELEGRASELSYPYMLLGYPEGLKEKKKHFGEITKRMEELVKLEPHRFELRNYGGIPKEKDRHYSAFLGFIVHTPRLITPKMEGWASGAALVEEIRGTPTDIQTIASLSYRWMETELILDKLKEDRLSVFDMESLPGLLLQKCYLVIIDRSEKIGEWKISKGRGLRDITDYFMDVKEAKTIKLLGIRGNKEKLREIARSPDLPGRVRVEAGKELVELYEISEDVSALYDISTDKTVPSEVNILAGEDLVTTLNFLGKYKKLRKLADDADLPEEVRRMAKDMEIDNKSKVNRFNLFEKVLGLLF
jgi:hypothetical protein